MIDQPRITALVCTYNRSDHLRNCLRSLAAQTLSPNEFEVIVVDNKTLLVTVPFGSLGPAEITLTTMPGGTATVSAPFVVKGGATAVFPWFLNGESGPLLNRTRIILRNNSNQFVVSVIVSFQNLAHSTWTHFIRQ